MTYVDVDDQATADLLDLVAAVSDTSVPSAERLIADYESVLLQLRDFPESDPVEQT